MISPAPLALAAGRRRRGSRWRARRRRRPPPCRGLWNGPGTDL